MAFSNRNISLGKFRTNFLGGTKRKKLFDPVTDGGIYFQACANR